MSAFFKAMENTEDAPFNMAMLYLIELNDMLRQKNVYRSSEDFDGWIRILVIIWDFVKGHINNVTKREIENIKIIDIEIEELYLLMRKTDNDLFYYPTIRKLDQRIMAYLWSYNLIFPPVIDRDPIKHIQKMYGIKKKAREKQEE